MLGIRILTIFVMGISFLMTYAQSTNDTKRDSTITKSRLAQGVKLSNVEVIGTQKFGIESSQMSAIQVTPLQIKRVPMFMGTPDVLKALQKLPGVNSEGEGTVGISVRGGNVDQNLITLDGATLYNPEHLKGYATAINPDMVSGIDFYRGAFPARYGSRLSSVIDVSMKEGDFKKYHGSLFLGMLSGSVTIEGPIWKDHTSFIVGGRMSYFDLLAYPILKEVYDNPDKLRPYSDMKYFDINAKLTHKFSERNKLSASFYYGKDRDNTAPTNGTYEKVTVLVKADEPGEFDQLLRNKSLRDDSTATAWSNICGSLNWNWNINDKFSVGANIAYSKYDYSIIQRSYYKSFAKEDAYPEPLENRDPYSLLEYLQIEDVNQDYFSKVEEGIVKAEFGWRPNKKHNLLIGVEGRLQEFIPQVRVKNEYYYKDLRELPTHERYVYIKSSNVDTLMGGVHSLKQYNLYVEDDYELNKNIKFNIGLRMALHSVTGKTYTSLEPRMSLRWRFLNHNAVKLSYSRMAQSTHRLATNNLVSTSELWVPITKDIPLMKSDLYALGYTYEPLPGISASIEGYYKTMTNIIEYKQNANYSFAMRDWSQMVSVGNGRSYGVELLLEKTTGNTTGWLSYTWSKALRKFDEAGNQLNGGREFYANNDRRHNLNVVLTHKLQAGKNSFWEFNASWTYQTGRRGTIPVAQLMGGRFAYFDGIARYPRYTSEVTKHPFDESFYHYNKDDWHIYDALRAVISTRDLNHYVLPSVHHLDLGINFVVKHKLGESMIGLSIYNVYNRKNANTAYVGFNDNKDLVLKYQCPFPIMPSFSYTHKF